MSWTTLPQHVEEKIIPEPNSGCWLWLGAISQGYGRFEHFLYGHYAHRFVYECLVKEIPEGLELDHKCRNRACCNPEHLEPVTKRENILRGFGVCANFLRRTTCNKGHPLVEGNLDKVKNGARICSTCRRLYLRHYMRKIRGTKNPRV